METKYTDLELQLWLAKQLPDEIVIYNVVTVTFAWIDGNYSVTTREWDHIVRLVEEKLTDEQWGEYIIRLGFQVGTIHANPYRNYQAMLSASFRNSAIAISQTLNIPIK